MAYVDIPGAWIGNIERDYASLLTGAPAILPTTSIMDAANEAIMVCGRLWLSNRATGVAFDTNSRIIFRTGTGNVFVEATSVLTIGIQAIDKTNGPPERGDGTYRVLGVIPSVTYADIANSTTYLAPMTTVNSATTLSHGDEICIKLELTTFTATDTVRIQCAPTQATSGGLGTGPFTNNVVTQFVSAAYGLLAGVPCPFLLDFEGDNSVIGYIDTGVPMVESFGTPVAFNNGSEHGMLFRPAVKMKLDAFWVSMLVADGINCEAYIYTDPLGTPAGTLIGTIDGDATASANYRPILIPCAPIEFAAATDYVFAIRSLGTSITSAPVVFNHINHVAHFGGFGVTDVRVSRVISGNPAFTTTAGQQLFWGARQSAIDDGAGGGGGGGQRVYGS